VRQKTYTSNADRQRAYRERKRNATKPNVTPYYQSANVTLFHGDCNAVMAMLPAGSVGAIVTDAPYGASTKGLMKRQGNAIVSQSFGEWDNISKKDLLAKYNEWSKEWYRLLRPGGAVVAFTGRRNINNVEDILEDAGFMIHPFITWLKPNPSPFALANRKTPISTEMAVWATKPGVAYTFNRGAWQHLGSTLDNSDVILQSTAPSHNRAHPTQKPEPLMGKLLAAFAKPGDVILDPFAGSGTTLVAARLRGLSSIGIEQSQKYCDAIVARLGQDVMGVA
jgi:modification methylase